MTQREVIRLRPAPANPPAATERHATPGAAAAVRRFLPELIRLIWDRTIDPGKVFDLTLPLDRAAEGYRAWTNAPPPRSC
jgi:hypothetical protein